MRDHIDLAIQNIVKHGDTDIFPFPFENRAFFDDSKNTKELLLEYHKRFEDFLNRYPPRHVDALAPAGYNGFRWATQLDPIWNSYFLACVLALGEKIESARIPKDKNIVFSYRFAPNPATGDLFDRNYTWTKFMKQSLELSQNFDHVVVCDISDFYPRIGHHQLENALKHIDERSDIPHRIMEFLKNFTNTRSYGLPIGGPAARILSELALNQIDGLLRSQGIVFTRYADDYHLFTKGKKFAYRDLIYLSEKLFVNQGLSLQKSKTRIVTAVEFQATRPIEVSSLDKFDDNSTTHNGKFVQPRSLFRLQITFDPYSPTAAQDYENLKSELRNHDIIGLLRAELQKSRIDSALSRRILQAVAHLDENVKDEAVQSILENSEIFYPIYSSVLIFLSKVFDKLSESTQSFVITEIRNMIVSDSPIMRVNIHLGYAIRVLALKRDQSSQDLLQQLYETKTSPLIRRDIIIIIANWGGWHWLSDIRNRFREMSGPEKRAFILASYTLRDEGKHWRQHIKNELTPFETLILKWASQRFKDPNWKIPL